MLEKKAGILYLLFLLLVSCAGETKNDQFTLNSTDEKQFSFDELTNNKGSVFIFLDYECPLSQNYTHKINELSDKYEKENIAFYGVFPNLPANNADVKMFKRKYNMDIIFLGDPEKKLTNYLEATVTPEAILVDSNKNTLYSGRIDNWATALGVKRQVTTSHELDDAINNFINNKEIKVKKTEPVGCIIE